MRQWKALGIIVALLEYRINHIYAIPFLSNAEGKLCLVLNLKYLNSFLHVISFKYEELRTAALMFEKDEFMFKFDLKVMLMLILTTINP